MPFPDKVAATVSWMLNNKPAVYRVIYLLQGALGLFLIVFGYTTGHDHYRLIRAGLRTQGVIVGHVPVLMRDTKGSGYDTAYMPVVQFQAKGEIVHFQNWLGSSSTGNLHYHVPVLYDPENPRVAIIDRPVMNWIPWAPCFVLGVFLVLVSIKNTVLAVNSPSPPSPGTPIS
jgi:hypothetical protein